MIRQPSCESVLRLAPSKRKVNIYFGDGLLSIDKSNFAHNRVLQEQIKSQLHIEQLALLDQKHSAAVCRYDQVERDYVFEDSADALISRTQGIGIGVVTADCLPIMVYDAQLGAIAAIHAGWRGSLLDITARTITHMQQAYGSVMTSLYFFFGPAARSCCYEVHDDVFQVLASRGLGSSPVVSCRGDKTFLDLINLNRALLVGLGIKVQRIDTSASICTICNPEFCSYRRYGAGYMRRQLSVIMLPSQRSLDC